VNGERREVTEGSTVSSLLEELGLHPRVVAVEYNGEILKRAAYGETWIAAGDRLEIVRFVQGGAAPSSAEVGLTPETLVSLPVVGLSFEDGAAIVPNGQGPLAQLVEQQTLNLRVRGSIPWRLTKGSSFRPPAFQIPRRSGPRVARPDAADTVPRCSNGGWVGARTGPRWLARKRYPPSPRPAARARAKVAELAYALDLGSSPVRGLGVRVPPFAPPEHSEARLQ
jgi:sulfur carrier protein